MLAVPILREHQLLGLVTVVDPEDGGFATDDIESLSALAVQAGVAIENARLHRRVEQQAITDALTGLANRRQFFEVLGREFERAQRFGHAAVADPARHRRLQADQRLPAARAPGRRRRAARDRRTLARA